MLQACEPLETLNELFLSCEHRFAITAKLIRDLQIPERTWPQTEPFLFPRVCHGRATLSKRSSSLSDSPVLPEADKVQLHN